MSPAVAALTALALLGTGPHGRDEAPDPRWTEGAELERALDAKEQELEALDLDGEDIRFGLFGAWNGWSLVVKVERRDTDCDGKVVWRRLAVFKTTSGVTYAPGEVATYRVGRYVGLNIFPASVPKAMGPVAMRRLRDLLVRRGFGTAPKEKARQQVLADLDAHLRRGRPYPGMLKEWVTGMKYLWSPGMGALKNLGLLEHLHRGRPQPLATPVEFRTRDRPSGNVFRALTTHAQLARDMSGLLVVDGITAQGDRWPGYNVHFRLFSGVPFVRVGEHEYAGSRARLFALDNGGSFYYPERAMKHLERRVSRFDARLVARVHDLARWVARDPKAVRRWLTVDRRAFGVFRRSLAQTLRIVDRKTRGRADVWFAPTDVGGRRVGSR